MLSQLGWKDVRLWTGFPPAPPPMPCMQMPRRGPTISEFPQGPEVPGLHRVLDKVRSFAAPNFGRMVWDEQGNESVTPGQGRGGGLPAFCIQRDRLTPVLLEECARYGEISISHEVEVLAIDWPQGKSGGQPAACPGEGEVRPACLWARTGSTARPRGR